MDPGLDRQAAFGQSDAEIFCVLFKLVAQFSRSAEQFERFQRRGNHRWCDRIGKQIRARALPQKIDNLLALTGETAAGASERFAKRDRDDLDTPHSTALFVCAPA